MRFSSAWALPMDLAGLSEKTCGRVHRSLRSVAINRKQGILGIDGASHNVTRPMEMQGLAFGVRRVGRQSTLQLHILCPLHSLHIYALCSSIFEAGKIGFIFWLIWAVDQLQEPLVLIGIVLRQLVKGPAV